jgi:hypothetical protein
MYWLAVLLYYGITYFSMYYVYKVVLMLPDVLQTTEYINVLQSTVLSTVVPITVVRSSLLIFEVFNSQ